MPDTAPSRDRGHLGLLCELDDLLNLVAQRTDITGFLNQATRLVSKHLNADVCSIYLYDEHRDYLVLRATLGLNPLAVGRIRMRPGEGLVGACFQEMTVVREPNADRNPRFKLFKEADEQGFTSFLAVPIYRGVQRIGVLTVQHGESGYFARNDALILKATASQLAGVVENARLLMLMETAEDRSEPETPAGAAAPLKFIKGRPAAPGFALAPAVHYRKNRRALLQRRSAESCTHTAEDFEAAVLRTEYQILRLQSRLTRRLPESASLIFTAHFMMLKDPKFAPRMADLIREGMCAMDAIRTVAERYIDVFSASSHTYIREKVADIEDLAWRLLENLESDDPADTGDSVRPERIVIARELFPSDILKMASEDVAGLLLVKGGVTTHVAILARSLKIPMIITDRPDIFSIPAGTPLLLDGGMGNVYVDPDERIMERFDALSRDEALLESSFVLPEETRTKDGVRIRLMANINLLNDVQAALNLNAEGVGLYRTEFPFIVRPDFPSEEEQYRVCRLLLTQMKGREVTIRTLDVGGEKALAYADMPAAENPELGLRSIRFSLHHPEIFETQLRALLRAGAENRRLRILFPMISDVDQFLRVRRMVTDCSARLADEGEAFHPAPRIGMMVEIPSVMEILEPLAEAADFFSIGTNDFVQYTLAVDRGNEKVAEYFQPHHPAILRGLNRIAAAGNAAGIDVSVCGEMGRDPAFIPFFAGIGIRTISAAPRYLPLIHRVISDLDFRQAREYADALLAEPTLAGIERIMKDAANAGFVRFARPAPKTGKSSAAIETP